MGPPEARRIVLPCSTLMFQSLLRTTSKVTGSSSSLDSVWNSTAGDVASAFISALRGRQLEYEATGCVHAERVAGSQGNGGGVGLDHRRTPDPRARLELLARDDRGLERRLAVAPVDRARRQGAEVEQRVV